MNQELFLQGFLTKFAEVEEDTMYPDTFARRELDIYYQPVIDPFTGEKRLVAEYPSHRDLPITQTLPRRMIGRGAISGLLGTIPGAVIGASTGHPVAGTVLGGLLGAGFGTLGAYLGHPSELAEEQEQEDFVRKYPTIPIPD